MHKNIYELISQKVETLKKKFFSFFSPYFFVMFYKTHLN